MIRLQTCCFCWDVKLGTSNIGFVYLIISALALFGNVISLAKPTQQAPIQFDTIGYFMTVGNIFIHSTDLVMSIVLILGTRKDLINVVLACVIYAIIRFILSIVHSVMFIYETSYYYLAMIYGFFEVVMRAYFFMVQWSYFRNIKEAQPTRRPIRRANRQSPAGSSTEESAVDE